MSNRYYSSPDFYIQPPDPWEEGLMILLAFLLIYLFLK